MTDRLSPLLTPLSYDTLGARSGKGPVEGRSIATRAAGATARRTAGLERGLLYHEHVRGDARATEEFRRLYAKLLDLEERLTVLGGGGEGDPGPAGPIGPVGPQGPPGPAGEALGVCTSYCTLHAFKLDVEFYVNPLVASSGSGLWPIANLGDNTAFRLHEVYIEIYQARPATFGDCGGDVGRWLLRINGGFKHPLATGSGFGFARLGWWNYPDDTLLTTVDPDFNPYLGNQWICTSEGGPHEFALEMPYYEAFTPGSGCVTPAGACYQARVSGTYQLAAGDQYDARPTFPTVACPISL